MTLMMERCPVRWIPELMEFGEWLREQRKLVRITQEDLGKTFGRTKGLVSQLENINHSTGKTMRLHPELLFSIADGLRSFGSKVTDQDVFRAAGVPIPEDPLLLTLENLGRVLTDDREIIGGTPCSDPDQREEENLGRVLAYYSADYVVVVQGDSMEPEYRDGDLLTVRREEKPTLGDFVIALVNGESVGKKLTGARQDDETGEWIYTLSPTNHEHRQIRATDVRFQGVVVAFTRATPRGGGMVTIVQDRVEDV